MRPKSRKRTAEALLVVMMSLYAVSESSRGDFTFGEPMNLGPPVNTVGDEYGHSVSADGLEIYFTSDQPVGGYDVMVATHDTTQDTWGDPVNLGPQVNSSAEEWCPRISPDGLELYFSSNREGGLGGRDIYVTVRESRDVAWGLAKRLDPPINSSGQDYAACVSCDGLELYFSSMRSDGYGLLDLYVAKRATKDSDWGEPENLGPVVNDNSNSVAPSLSLDGRHLFFSGLHIGRVRSGGLGNPDIWVTTRATREDPWGTPINLGPPINTSEFDGIPWISYDGSMLTFYSSRAGGLGGADIWQASVEPVVDFNADGIVDCADVSEMIDFWGTDNTLYDIGPMPWGDGVVDAQDLLVLAEYMVNTPVAVNDVNGL